MYERKTGQCEHVTGWIWNHKDLDQLCPKTSRALVLGPNIEEIMDPRFPMRIPSGIDRVA
jgi:hypothetical protein